jgi:hypothetical protein
LVAGAVADIALETEIISSPKVAGAADAAAQKSNINKLIPLPNGL